VFPAVTGGAVKMCQDMGTHTHTHTQTNTHTHTHTHAHMHTHIHTHTHTHIQTHTHTHTHTHTGVPYLGAVPLDPGMLRACEKVLHTTLCTVLDLQRVVMHFWLRSQRISHVT
jgi:ABC-type Zn2+ transport system substrate-binding protein/surface adhesin